MKSILIFGRQPELGLAEIESLYGPEAVLPIDGGAVCSIDACNLAFSRLGGSLKLASLLAELDYTDWNKIASYLEKESVEPAKKVPAGKLTLGLSAYNFDISGKETTSLAIKLKKAIQAAGRSVRVVPNKTPDLNTASVIHNKLTSEKGWEIILIKSGGKTYVGRTVMVQDISAYRRRDQARPKRDARVGMLPPKLAQIIINLASKRYEVNDQTDNCEPPKLEYKETVLDPFCGSGVIPQEALLAGYNVVASDIDERMVSYTQENIKWLKENFQLSSSAQFSATIDDATTAKWPSFDFVATETNLGKPLSVIPADDELQSIIDQSNRLIKAFLLNLAQQTKSGSKHCIAIPAWKTKNNTFTFLPVIDRLEELGYNLAEFKHINSARQLIYYRPDQIVARQLLVIVRK